MSIKISENPFLLCDSFANSNEEERLILACSKTWATGEEIEQYIGVTQNFAKHYRQKIQ